MVWSVFLPGQKLLLIITSALSSTPTEIIRGKHLSMSDAWNLLHICLKCLDTAAQSGSRIAGCSGGQAALWQGHSLL